ncbi:helix-turn-helix transcriptional regulator [Undibacterium hunanense]|uniref:helix-turn-helix transcriptional regulator n=1 Tax=Undibacterium hunanense TaxID=2762292 RepID=UPI001C9B725E|nr:YafY family protein [Undibacterium hunanense]
MSSIYHPTTRVLAVLELLQAHGRLGGAELADMLNIDRRSLRRYIVTLEEMGIPVMTERGRYGGYALMPGFKLPPMMFSDDEALALTTGLLAARRLGLVDAAPAIASSLAKLQRLLPDKLKRKLQALEEVVQLDLVPSTKPADQQVLGSLSEAVMQQLRVHLEYRAADGNASNRDFDTYGVAFHAACWYAVGFCHLRKDIRSFRLDRILSVRVLDTHFERPARFNVVQHLRKAVATLPRAFSTEVLLKTDMYTAGAHLSDAIGVLEQCSDGVLLHNQSDDLDWLARQLAALPFEFVIHKPQQLRLEVKALARRLTKA